MQPVGQFDKDHPDIVGHGQQHLPEIFRLFFLIRPERNLADFRDAFNEVGHCPPEMRLQLFTGRHGIFQRVMQQPCHNGRHIELEEG